MNGGQLTCLELCRGWNSIREFCEKLDLKEPPDFRNPRNCVLFEPHLTGDGIRRACGAVGHDCEECYIHCPENPDDWYGGREEEEESDFGPDDWI